MNKKIQLSVAALALVNGLFANAQSLENAIKNVDVSGTVAMRYNDYKDDVNANNSATNQYKAAINIKSKVNDDVTFNSRFIAANTSGAADQTTSKVFGTSSEGDQSLNATLSEVNFTYTGVENLAVTVGKQGVFSPWTRPRIALGKEQTGTAIKAQYNLNSVVFTAAYFNQTNFDKAAESYTFLKKDAGADFAMVGLNANIANTAIDAYYGTVKDSFDAYTIGVKSNFDFNGIKFTPFARYSALDIDKSTPVVAGVKGTQELWQIGATLRKDIYKLFAAYGETGNDGGLVFVDYTSTVGMDYHWRVTANKDADAKYTYVHTTADITPKTTVGVFYSKADKKEANKDVSEIYGQVVYKMSKNLLTYLRYGVLDDESAKTDGTMGRLHVRYSF